MQKKPIKDAWSVTFEVWDEESSAHGAIEDDDKKGFVVENCTFREAIEYCGGLNASYHPSSAYYNGVTHDYGCSDWFTNDDYNEDYRTGETEQRSFHIPDGVTRASRNRIARLLGIK